MREGYHDLDTLDSLTRVEGVLVNEAPLRVGVGRGGQVGSPMDLAVYRLGKVPCIPGSSLKGAFRSYLEVLEASRGSRVHSPWEEDGMEICPICGIFGSTKLASHLRVYDAPVIGEYSTLIKTGVSLDRDFGAQRPGLLYTEELVSPGCNWRFKMDIFNIGFPPSDDGDKRAVLIQRLLDALRAGDLHVGARRSVGSGIIRLKEAIWRRYEILDGRLKKTEEGSL
jgi:CRISPR-associated protein Csm3